MIDTTYKITLPEYPGLTFTVSDYNDDGEQFAILHAVEGLESYAPDSWADIFGGESLSVRLTKEARRIAKKERAESNDDFYYRTGATPPGFRPFSKIM